MKSRFRFINWTATARVLIAVLGIDCHRSLYSSVRKKKLAKHVVLEVGFAIEASKKNIYIFLAHHHLKSSVLRWRPVLSRFYPGNQQ